MSQLKYWNGTAWVTAVVGAEGPQGPSGVQGSSGVINVNSPITNSGGTTSANLGIDYTALQYGRNILINGAFEINQRAYASATNLASEAYGFDRWKSTFTNTTLTFTSAPQGQLVTINSGGSIKQVVERQNIRAGTYTLSWQGTAAGRIYNTGATAPTYAASPITVTLDGLANVEVEFTASGGNRTLGFVQLEAGALATPFKRNGSYIQAELDACQRYYTTSPNIAIGYQTDTNGFGQSIFFGFPSQMRIAPTVTVGFTNVDNATNAGVSSTVPTGFVHKAYRGNASFSYYNYTISYTATAEL
jgi:hypothetical protein